VNNQLKNGAPHWHVLRLPMQHPSKVGFSFAKDAATGVFKSLSCTLLSSSGDCWIRQYKLKSCQIMRKGLALVTWVVKGQS